ncbi:MAG: tetratricopeptide repeat protein, partial [Armatimonadetes bacterium]|nr:tetratricopeptide repeat protein [Armatimonadota bacterium]
MATPDHTSDNPSPGQFSAGEWFEQGRRAERNGQLAEAEHAYRQALVAEPERAPWHYRMGCVLRKLD